MQRWLMIAVLLAAAALSVRDLDSDALWEDEIRSYRHAGGTPYGPETLAQVWQAIANNAPDQAPGYFLLLNQWGGVLGWSELATRSLSWLVGVLTIALVYRLGSDVFSRWHGLLAATALSSSAFFLHFMHEGRPFALGMMFVPLLLLYYWRLVYDQGRWPVYIGLVVGALGLFYSHYFVALVLPALALYHIIFAPKTRRWFIPPLLAVPVLALLAPNMSLLLGGVSRTANREALHRIALSPWEALYTFLQYFGQGVPLLTVAVFGLVVAALWHEPQRRAVIFVLFMAGATLALILAVHTGMQVIAPGRQRYFAGMWPLMALAAAVAVNLVWQQRRSVGAVVLVGWLLLGLWTMRPGGLAAAMDGADVANWRGLQRTVAAHIAEQDVIALHAPFMPWLAIPYFEHYMAVFPVRAELIESMEEEPIMQDYVSEAERVWLAVYRRYPLEPQLATFEGVLGDEFTRCETWQIPEFEVRLLARDTVFCPGGAVLATFGPGVMLTGFTVEPTCSGEVEVLSSWRVDDAFPAAAYSVALHAVDESGDLLVQADDGLGAGPARTVLSVEGGVDVMLRAGVYNWQTGERLGEGFVTLGELGFDAQGCVTFQPT